MFYINFRSGWMFHLIVLTVLCGILFFFHLGSLPFFDKGEPREAIVVEDIVVNANWLFPLRMGSEIPSKPPLFHWFGALASIARGKITEPTVRFPSALFAALGVLSLYLLGRKIFTPGVGFLAGVILATSLDYQRMAISARVDMTLTFFVTLSLVLFFSLYRGYLVRSGWFYAFYSILGVGVLAKGPVSLVLSGLIIVGFLALQKRWDFLYRLCFHRGVVLMVILALSWYALALATRGEEFFNRQFMHENIARFFSYGKGGAGHQKPIYYYFPYLLSGGLPWSLFIPFVAVDWFKGRRSGDEGSLFLGVWVLVVFVFFSLAAGKRPPYILALYPPLSLLVAAWFQRSVEIGKSEKIGLRLMGVGSLVVAILLVVSIIGTVWDEEPAWFLSSIVPALKPKDQANFLIVKEGLVRAGAPFLFFLFFSSVLWISLSRSFWTSHVRALPPRLALISLLSGFLGQNIVMPLIAEARSYGPFMKGVNRLMAKGGQLYLYGGDFDRNQLIFYRGDVIPVLRETPGKAVERLASSEDYIIMSEKEWRRMHAMGGSQSPPLLKSMGSGPGGDAPLVLIQGKPPEP